MELPVQRPDGYLCGLLLSAVDELGDCGVILNKADGAAVAENEDGTDAGADCRVGTLRN